VTLAVQTPAEVLGSLEKPPLQSIKSLVLQDEDLLIVCAGFEDRAIAAVQSVAERSRQFSVLVINYLPFVAENKASVIRSICKRAGVRFTEATYDREKPSGFGTTVLDVVDLCQGKIFIDISAMSRLLIVQILVALRQLARAYDNCRVVYTEASEYPPSREEAMAQLGKSDLDPTFAVLFLSSGVFEVTVIPELSSVAPPGTQTRLVAFPSLDAHQLTAIRAEIHPSRFDFIEGEPPSERNAWRQDLIARLNRLAEVPNSTRHQLSTLDYGPNLQLLTDLYGARPEQERLFICPTGSKMQTVAVGLFRAFAQDVQIVYPTPQKFLTPSSYTQGVGPLHLLDLSAFSVVRETA
jgi:hypothetical protein